MSPEALDRAAVEVLHRYPVGGAVTLYPLGNRGGFSGARLWRAEATIGVGCLRLWPPDDSFPVRLDYIHHLMIGARAAGLEFVPRLFLTAERRSYLEHRGRWWELAEWRPGCTDFRAHPSAARLEVACSALARLHLVWQRDRSATNGTCSAIARRLASVRSWQELQNKGWQPLLAGSPSDSLHPLVERALTVLARWLPSVPEALAAWTQRRWPLQPCLCDVWHDHLLFEGDRLTGLVDYGAVKLDHITVDLSRLLGSLVEDDADRWRIGLAAYRSVRPLSADEEALARVLDRTGTHQGVANWLRWLYADRRVFENREAVARRLETLIVRIQRWGTPIR